MEPQEILASQIELYHAIECVDPRITRYSVGKKFSKLYFDRGFMSWIAVSRQSGALALLGSANIKGVRLMTEREVAEFLEAGSRRAKVAQMQAEAAAKAQAELDEMKAAAEAAPAVTYPNQPAPAAPNPAFKPARSAPRSIPPRQARRQLVPQGSEGTNG